MLIKQTQNGLNRRKHRAHRVRCIHSISSVVFAATFGPTELEGAPLAVEWEWSLCFPSPPSFYAEPEPFISPLLQVSHPGYPPVFVSCVCVSDSVIISSAADAALLYRSPLPDRTARRADTAPGVHRWWRSRERCEATAGRSKAGMRR